MKPLDKKEMPKLIALIIVAVAIFGYALVQFAGVGAPAAADGGTKEVKPKPALAAATPTPPPAFDVASLGPPSGGKDPFLPSGAAAPKTVAIAVPGPKIAPPAPSLPAIMEKPSSPIFGATPILPAGSDTAAPTSAIVLPPPPPPNYAVTGIVLGDGSQGSTNIAVLRGIGTPTAPVVTGLPTAPGMPVGAPVGTPVQGDPDRRFVRVGDSVGNGFVVAAIHADGVEIKSGDRRITLKLGNGNTRAK